MVDAIVALAARASVGEGGALTIIGESGIGKTAVLDEASALIATDRPECRVLRLNGVEAEVELAWSGLAWILDGTLDRVQRLAPARRAAILGALAIEPTDQPVEPFAIALATRDLLVDAAEGAPLVIIVDDLPWVDLPTRRTLSYIARRLQFERLAIVSARRFGADAHTDTGPTLRVDAVSDEVADQILRDAGVGSAAVRRELVAAAGGLPLVLVEAANLLDADQRAGRAELPDPLPIGRTGQRVVDLLLERLDSNVRAALLVAAAEPDGDLARIVKALTEGGLGVSELEAAEAAGIVSLDGDRLSFRHPLMRAAAYHDASRADRRAAHRALAGTLPPDAPSRAWHLARAAVGPDESVASALDAAATVTVSAVPRHRRRARGSWPAGSRRSLPTASVGCGWRPTPSSTRAWRQQRAGSSTAPTPSSPTTALPTMRSNGSAVSSCAAGCHRRAAAASSRSPASAGQRSTWRRASPESPWTCSSTPSPRTCATVPTPT